MSFGTSASAALLTAPTTSFNWNTGTPWNSGTAAWNSATPDDAVFGNITAGRTVTLGANTTAGTVSFSHAANDWTVTPAGFGLTVNTLLTNSGTGRADLGSTIVSGNGAVSVTSGTLRMTGANTYTGGLTVGAGSTFQIGNGLGSTGSAGAPTSGALGAGLVTLNGGTVTWDANRTHFNNLVFGGDVTLQHVSGGGSRSITFNNTSNDLGAATRTLNVLNSPSATTTTVNLNGPISGSAAGGLTKTGDGILSLGGTNTYTGLTTVNGGELRLSNGTANANSIAGNVLISSGTLRNMESQNIADGATVTMNGGSWNLSDGSNNRNERIQKLVVNGGTFAMAGTSQIVLTQATGGVTTDTDLAVNVNLGGELAGDTGGSLNVNVVAREGGIFSPGNGTAGDTGTLGLGAGLDLSLLNSADQGIFNFDLGATADRINITGGNFVGAGTGGVVLNLTYTSGTLPGSFVLFDWAGATASGISLADFTIGTASPEFAGYFLGISGTQLTYAIPEPSTIALLAGALGSLALFRRRRLA